MPYADCFYTTHRYCLTFVSRTSCSVVTHANVVFVKSTMLKSVIQRAAYKGIEEFADHLRGIAQKEAATLSVHYRPKPSKRAKKGKVVAAESEAVAMASPVVDSSTPRPWTSTILGLPPKMARPVLDALQGGWHTFVDVEQSIPISVHIGLLLLLIPALFFWFPTLFDLPGPFSAVFAPLQPARWSFPTVAQQTRCPFTLSSADPFASSVDHAPILLKDWSSLLTSSSAIDPTFFSANTTGYHLAAHSAIHEKLMQSRLLIGHLRRHLLQVNEALTAAEVRIMTSDHLTTLLDDLALCWHRSPPEGASACHALEAAIWTFAKQTR